MDETGGPEVLVARTGPDPEAGADEVVVDVAFASVTFIETQVRAGAGPFPVGELPRIPGNGVGGTVASVGPGADPALVGRRVVTTTGGVGGYATAVAVPASGLVPVPDGVALDVATALLADGRTATALAAEAALAPGERVLVLAAAGGVGTLLVQLARDAGGLVVGAVGSEDKLEVARASGATEVVAYAAEDWADAIAPVDVVFDGVGGEVGRAAFERCAPGGRVVRFGMASGAFTAIDPAEAEAREVTLVAMPRPSPEEASRLTAAALAAADEGRLAPVIGQRVALADAADAHRAIASRRTKGKTLLVV